MAYRLLNEEGKVWIKRERKIMAPEILVVLKNQDCLSHMIPYIEEVAQPGMKIVFLIRSCPPALPHAFGDNGSELDRLEEMRFAGHPEEPRFIREKIGAVPLIDKHRLVAEHKVFLALETLLKRGIELTVDVYTGSLRRVVKSYVRKGNVNLIMKSTRRVANLFELIHRTLPLVSLFKEPTRSPIRLRHANQVVS
jgi:hypothetical protein